MKFLKFMTSASAGEEGEYSDSGISMYRLVKSFCFKSDKQVNAFVEVASYYGKCKVFSDHILIFEAKLDFTLWRKIIILADLISREPGEDLRSLSARAGLRVLRKLP